MMRNEGVYSQKYDMCDWISEDLDRSGLKFSEADT